MDLSSQLLKIDFRLNFYSNQTPTAPCDSLASPVNTKCQGCPPMYNGKPCASTTRYTGLSKGSCGCGSDPNPPNFWTKTRYTAAGNAAMMDDMNPLNSWCTKNCGLCFEVCTTGGSHTGASHTPDECIVVQIENRSLLRQSGLVWSCALVVGLN